MRIHCGHNLAAIVASYVARSHNHGFDLGRLSKRCTSLRAPDARSWPQILTRYRAPNHARSIVEIAITLGPLVTLWVLAWVGYYLGFWWLSLLIAVPAAGFLVRLFMIQHDCGHGAFFSHRMANDWWAGSSAC